MGAQLVVPVSIPPLRGPAYEWALWSTTIRVVTDDPQALPLARRLIDGELAQVELAASRLRPARRSARCPPAGGPGSARR
jgi:thiamine biosynthesis lipoprotein